MSDSTRFTCDYAKRKANCKKCKQPIDKGVARIAKVTPNFFNDGDGEMKMYHHINCMFEVFSRARATTKKIEDPSDLEGFANMEDDEKTEIKKLIVELCAKQAEKQAKSPRGGGKKATPKKQKPAKAPSPVKMKASPLSKPIQSASIHTLSTSADSSKPPPPFSKDNNFREYRRLCAMIADESSYNEKTNIVKNFITHGASGSGYTGDLHILIKLLLPGSIKRTYNLQNKTIAKIFSRIFDTDLDEMMEHLEQGDVSETVFKFFEESDFFPPCKKSNLTIHDVDGMLGRLEGLTREEDQENVLKTFARKCTANDLKAVIRLIKGDLRITAGDKHILEALDPNAHEAFKASRDLEDVIKRTLEQKKSGGSGLEVRASLMTPVAPMLAEACKSVEQAMKKCPNGMYSEIKYDGERVQLHMDKGNFQFYSRSLKPVQKHKKPEDLKSMIVRVIKDGLEGLVLKDVKSIYEPGKRHWLKVKKDYLCQGAMADTADLVVLGAYIGTGSKGGLMSVFLMGVHDPHTDRWKTVTKVGNGHDDQTIDKINKELKVQKIQKDFNRVPKWLLLNRQYVPDYIVEDPKSAPVWEITGTEFSKSDAHTADGISIRFPRVTRIRDDKDWKTATNLPRLKKLFAKSKEESDISALLDKKSGTSTVKIEQRSMKLDDGASSSSPLKRKRDPGTTPVKKIPKIKQENGGKASFLHDVFTDMKFAISSSVKDQEKMKRYIVAFDGDIVEDYDVSSATHTIGKIDSDDIPSDCKTLTEDYIWTCIKKKKLVA
uniref:DNA ligase 3-like isoform X2 n=1 Tax=Styela clava TaxID=7725 RepID=UPI00193A21EB|nr:DNA ligase 3-like isoform X2 [Styela clava]